MTPTATLPLPERTNRSAGIMPRVPVSVGGILPVCGTLPLAGTGSPRVVWGVVLALAAAVALVLTVCGGSEVAMPGDAADGGYDPATTSWGIYCEYQCPYEPTWGPEVPTPGYDCHRTRLHDSVGEDWVVCDAQCLGDKGYIEAPDLPRAMCAGAADALPQYYGYSCYPLICTCGWYSYPAEPGRPEC